MVTERVDDVQVTAWAVAAAGGDRAALAAFVEATRRDVHRFVAHLASAREADDLTQETYLRALRALPGFAGRSTARTWLLAIARHAAADAVRTALRRPRTSGVDDWEAIGAQRGVRRSAVDEAVVLRALVADLDPDRREAFVLTQVLGLPYAEAAEVCDCPVGTIRSRVARAREDLVEAIDAASSARPRLVGEPVSAGNRGGRPDDHRSMTCQHCRDAVSAMLDGEQLPEDEFVVRHHLPRCADCRAAAHRAREITLMARSWRTDPVPDPASDLLEVLLGATADPGPGSAGDGPTCAGDHGHLRPVGNAACGCAAACSCGCQQGKQCQCGHAVA